MTSVARGCYVQGVLIQAHRVQQLVVFHFTTLIDPETLITFLFYCRGGVRLVVTADKTGFRVIFTVRVKPSRPISMERHVPQSLKPIAVTRLRHVLVMEVALLESSLQYLL
ncbi:hypothetical protein J6590_023193 [Homalodisca vitripennis]|nr:hypothetical protein J6590_023193 [Homalodisca vitripennis]